MRLAAPSSVGQPSAFQSAPGTGSHASQVGECALAAESGREVGREVSKKRRERQERAGEDETEQLERELLQRERRRGRGASAGQRLDLLTRNETLQMKHPERVYAGRNWSSGATGDILERPTHVALRR